MLEESSGVNSDEDGVWLRYDYSALVFHHNHISIQGRPRHHLCSICTQGLGGAMAEVAPGGTVPISGLDQSTGVDEESTDASPRDSGQREGGGELSPEHARAREMDAGYLQATYGL